MTIVLETFAYFPLCLTFPIKMISSDHISMHEGPVDKPLKLLFIYLHKTIMSLDTHVSHTDVILLAQLYVIKF